jgi:hypothetical protein
MHFDCGHVLWRDELAAGTIKFEHFGPNVYLFVPRWAFGKPPPLIRNSALAPPKRPQNRLRRPPFGGGRERKCSKKVFSEVPNSKTLKPARARLLRSSCSHQAVRFFRVAISPCVSYSVMCKWNIPIHQPTTPVVCRVWEAAHVRTLSVLAQYGSHSGLKLNHLWSI